MKKKQPPILTVVELRAKVIELLTGPSGPVKPLEFLVNQFNGWDLEAMIFLLKQEEKTQQLKKEV